MSEQPTVVDTTRVSDPWVTTSQDVLAQLGVVTHENLLDDEVRVGKAVPGRWFLVGLAQVLLPVATLIAVVLLVLVLRLPHGDIAGSAYGVLAQLLTAAGVWVVARNLAAQHGGWGSAFGLRPPSRTDARVIGQWTGRQIAARFGVVLALGAVTPGLRPHGGNLEGVSHLRPAALLIAGVGAVVVAPVMEELAFRGIVLRGLMRRMPFLPAAMLSSTLFGSLHVLGVAHLAGFPFLFVWVTTFGFLQCVLVRRTGYLGPAIAVHAIMNFSFLALAVLVGT